MSGIRIGSDFEIEKTDYEQTAQFDWRAFYGFRNNVIRALGQFGTVGPLGEVDLLADEDEAPNFIGETVDDPDFFVVDDMHNAHDKISIVECAVRHVNAEVIHALVKMAALFPGWHVILNMGDSGLRVFGDRVLVGGRRFWDCSDIAAIGRRCEGDVDYGPEPEFQQSMYGLWVDLVCGGFSSAKGYPDPPDREWREALVLLGHMLRESNGDSLGAHSYSRVRYDLHPRTRRKMLERFLAEAGSLPTGRLKEAARWNIPQDAADALATALSPDEIGSFVGLISVAQSLAGASLDPGQIVFWWPNIIERLKAIDQFDRLRATLAAEMRKLLESKEPWIQLSGVFALAKLGAPDIAAAVDRALRTNQQWLANDPLLQWLLKIRNGSVLYPSGLVLK